MKNAADHLLEALLVVAGLALGLLLARLRTRRRIARSRAIGRRGEERALDLLARNGYRVLAREVTGRGLILVDGQEQEYRVRADAVVRKWFRRYVAEFKGGAVSADPANRATRRQLLEYSRVFGVTGVLLIDADAGRIRRVVFPCGARAARRSACYHCESSGEARQEG